MMMTNRPLVVLGLAAAAVMQLTAGHTSVLSDAAAELEPGESIRLDTPLTGSIVHLEGSDILQWGSSAVWDPVRQEVRWIGKRDGIYPYHFLVYDAASNTWSNDRPDPFGDEAWGHGYDHNTVNPATGAHYIRGFNSKTVHKWDGGWTTLPDMPTQASVAAAIAWFPGMGLVYADRGDVRYFDGSSWRTLDSSPINFGLHNAAEYNPLADVLIYGGGNDSDQMQMLDADKNITTISTPPFNLGAAPSQGVLVSDPSSPKFIGWQKKTRNWVEYDVANDQWNNLSQSSGDGASPQTGTPDLSTSKVSDATVAAPIDSLGVIMFIQYLGTGDTRAGVWLYRHGDGVADDRPNPPMLEN